MLTGWQTSQSRWLAQKVRCRQLQDIALQFSRWQAMSAVSTPTSRLRVVTYLAAQLDCCGGGGRKQGHWQAACSHSPQASCHMGRIPERGHAARMPQ